MTDKDIYHKPIRDLTLDEARIRTAQERVSRNINNRTKELEDRLVEITQQIDQLQNPTP